MRVALLTNNLFPPREGIGRHIFEIASRMRGHGIEPWIVAKGGQRRGWHHGRWQGLALSRYPYLGLRPFHQHLLRRTLQTWCDGSGQDVDLIHLHLPLLPPLRTVRETLVTFHSPLLSDTAAIPEKDWRARLIKLNARFSSCHIEQHHIENARRLVAVSYGVAAELRQHYEIGTRPVEVITNGADTKFFPFVRGQCRQHRMLYVGRLGYRKGLNRLLDALAILKDSKLSLDIAGEGPLQGALQKRAGRLGLESRVRFLGFLDRNQLRERLKMAALLVNPADYETGPLTVLEAMSSGTPVVTTPTGIAAEMGAAPPLVMAHANAPSLAAAIESVLGDPELARARACEARSLVERQFDWEVITGKLAALYREPERLAA